MNRSCTDYSPTYFSSCYACTSIICVPGAAVGHVLKYVPLVARYKLGRLAFYEEIEDSRNQVSQYGRPHCDGTSPLTVESSEMH